MSEKLSTKIEESWFKVLSAEFKKPYFVNLEAFLSEERRLYEVYPPCPFIFNAFNRTPFHNVKVVILGQDPYHGKGHAHGLCFSVPHGIQPPPTLKNIYREIHGDLGIAPSSSGNLECWATQGVLLLNTSLTVRASTTGAHQNRGWERFTDNVIKCLSAAREHLVFILWGNSAHAKETLIDEQKHLTLKASHPSILTANSGFFGCRHFSKANDYLIQHGIEPIDWSVNY